MSTEAYPLKWPKWKPRTPVHERERARFSRQTSTEHRYGDGSSYTRTSKASLTVAEALKRVLLELGRADAGGVVISTNVELRNDGLPYSNRREPIDPGVALYFTRSGKQICMPCDKWDKVADNLAAVAAHIASMRGQERWGVISLDEAFDGFKALPANGDSGLAHGAWWQILGVDQDSDGDLVKMCYRKLAAKNHPDSGGDAGAMAVINRAYEQFKTERF